MEETKTHIKILATHMANKETLMTSKVAMVSRVAMVADLPCNSTEALTMVIRNRDKADTVSTSAKIMFIAD